jgi:hypothetical protein
MLVETETGRESGTMAPRDQVKKKNWTLQHFYTIRTWALEEFEELEAQLSRRPRSSNDFVTDAELVTLGSI